jgi:hypothetical protein
MFLSLSLLNSLVFPIPLASSSDVDPSFLDQHLWGSLRTTVVAHPFADAFLSHAVRLYDAGLAPTQLVASRTPVRIGTTHESPTVDTLDGIGDW